MVKLGDCDDGMSFRGENLDGAMGESDSEGNRGSTRVGIWVAVFTNNGCGRLSISAASRRLKARTPALTGPGGPGAGFENLVTAHNCVTPVITSSRGDGMRRLVLVLRRTAVISVWKPHRPPKGRCF